MTKQPFGAYFEQNAALWNVSRKNVNRPSGGQCWEIEHTVVFAILVFVFAELPSIGGRQLFVVPPPSVLGFLGVLVQLIAVLPLPNFFVFFVREPVSHVLRWTHQDIEPGCKTFSFASQEIYLVTGG